MGIGLCSKSGGIDSRFPVNNSLRTSEDYELFLYTITDQFPSVRRSTVTLIRRGATIARVTGEIYFDSNVRLVVRERLV